MNGRLLLLVIATTAHVLGGSLAAGTLDQKATTKVAINGTVLQVLPDGVMVKCDEVRAVGYKKAEGTVFVQNAPGLAQLVDGSKVRFTAAAAGTYQYTSILGATQTVAKFDARR